MSNKPPRIPTHAPSRVQNANMSNYQNENSNFHNSLEREPSTGQRSSSMSKLGSHNYHQMVGDLRPKYEHEQYQDLELPQIQNHDDYEQPIYQSNKIVNLTFPK